MNYSDQLINQLESKLSNIELPIRGTCGGCTRPIYGRMAEANGQKFHPEHFACSSCHNLLGTEKFFLVENKFICSNCLNRSASVSCGFCNQPIEGRCIEALGKSWHPDHFKCSQCSKKIEGSYFQSEGKPICNDCGSKN